MTRLLHRLRAERGFTLVEMTIALVMLAILVAAFSTLFSGMLHTTSEVNDESVLQTEVRGAVDRLVAQLTQAYIGDGTPPITTMGPTSITFTTPDNQTPMHLRKVAYQLSGTNFQWSAVTSTSTDTAPWSVGGTSLAAAALSPWSTMVRSVKNATIFTYYDSTGAVTASPSAVTSVGITLSVQPNTSQGRQFTYSSSATVRNPQ